LKVTVNVGMLLVMNFHVAMHLAMNADTKFEVDRTADYRVIPHFTLTTLCHLCD